jgi:UDP-N-acetylglucosamine 2-epimerase (non-hydrolysing)
MRGQTLNICTIIGTRPEAIKMAPVVIAAKARAGVAHQLIATGQQDALFDQAIDGFDVAVDHHLGVQTSGSDLAGHIDAMRAALVQMFAHQRPDLVLVQGDTNSAYAAALAAHEKGIAIGHVEAGLRTHVAERPWPEERNRVAIAKIATFHFAPSLKAMENLGAERVPGTAFLTGNPGIDALMMSAQPSTGWPNSVHHITVTCHRRENFGAPLEGICRALRTLAEREDVLISVPLHPNSQVRLTILSQLDDVPRIDLIKPLDYPDMIAAIRASRLVISDSGGLQEECGALGIPLILMRDETERPEVVLNGNCVLTGASPAKIIDEANRLLDDDTHHRRMSNPCLPYGDGNAAKRILDIITHFA